MSVPIIGQDSVQVPTIEELASAVGFLLELTSMQTEAIREMADRITALEGEGE